jgi:hypothetical protein
MGQHPRLRAAFLVTLVVLWTSATANAAPHRLDVPAPSGSAARPDTYGTTSYNVTAISDLAFTPYDSALTYTTNVSDYFRFMTSPGGGEWATSASIPAGAVIDWLGLTSCDEPGNGFSVYLYEAAEDGTYTQIDAFLSSAHGAASPCQTDYNQFPLDHLIAYNARRTLQVLVNQEVTASTNGSARFGAVEIWWHRTVSAAPAVATFNDVPTDHPFFQYIEALAASQITGGCGNGNYCPNAPLTRGQMAVFLAKALGLHFPANPPI